MKIVWRKRAQAAYLKQIAYIKAENKQAAERLQGVVEYRLDLLSHHPEMGRPSRRPNARELVFSSTPYAAVYQIADQTITILQFFHTRQNR